MVKKKHIPPVVNTIDTTKLGGLRVQQVSTSPGNCSFSFKYLQTDELFPFEYDEASYYHTIIERLQALSTTSVSDILASRSSALRCHPIDWDDIRVSRKSFGIPREEEICDKPYQISISKAKGRIHGFFTGDIFNIVWFDKDHALYPGSGK